MGGAACVPASRRRESQPDPRRIITFGDAESDDVCTLLILFYRAIHLDGVVPTPRLRIVPSNTPFVQSDRWLHENPPPLACCACVSCSMRTPFSDSKHHSSPPATWSGR